MEFRSLLRDRHSVRSFRPDDVEQEKVLRILQDAIRSPSAGNLQSWEFMLVRNADVKKRLAEAALDQDFIAEAPVVLVVCADTGKSGWKYGDRGKNFYCLLDVSMASMIILLSAAEEGLGACFVAAFDDREISEILSLPEQVRPIGIIPIGYSGEMPEITSRMPLDKVLHIETW